MKTDQELVKAFIGGDKHSFAELYNKYKNSLLGFLISYTKNSEMAEDIFQKSFVKFFENANNLARKKKLNFKSWIFKVAINLCKDDWKSSYNKKTQNWDIEKTADFLNNPETKFEKQWEFEKIQEAMEFLPEKLNKTLSLYYYSDFSLKEISRILHIPLGTVKSRINNGLKILNSKLNLH